MRSPASRCALYKAPRTVSAPFSPLIDFSASLTASPIASTSNVHPPPYLHAGSPMSTPIGSAIPDSSSVPYSMTPAAILPPQDDRPLDRLLFNIFGAKPKLIAEFSQILMMNAATSNKPVRHRLTVEQKTILMKAYDSGRELTDMKKSLSQQTGLPETKVAKWFYNEKAKRKGATHKKKKNEKLISPLSLTTNHLSPLFSLPPVHSPSFPSSSH